MVAQRSATATLDWLVGGGEMGKLIRSMDWSQTPLGPIASWPQSLRTTVSLCLASNFPISIAWGPHHVQIYNDGYWPVCGAKHPFSMGQDFSECWASAWPAIGEAFQRACEGETSYVENRRMFLDRNGYLEETFFTFSFSPIRDESGGVGGLFHPVTELTQQTLAERRLKVIRDLADCSPEAKSVAEAVTLVAQTLAQHDLDLPLVLIYLVDGKGQQAYLAQCLGIDPDTIASPTTVDLMTDPSCDRSRWQLSTVWRSRQSLQLDNLADTLLPLARGPYPEPPSSALVLPILLPGLDDPFGFLVAGVSPRRSLDQPYRLFYEMLQDAVTSALSNARAYELERQRAETLAELDRAKTLFFSNVSHEFRTPLTLMLAPTEDALSDTTAPLPPIQRDRLEIVHRNSLRLLKLVNTLLDFSRIEAGRIQSVYEPTDLAQFTADLASTFRSLIERAGMALVVDCPPLDTAVYVDREMWEKIVLNLLSNAFKFTFTGTITVRLRRVNQQVELAIADTGIGIPAAELPRLFDRFHRVKAAQGRSFEGSGIGLSLVQELVRLHAGTIQVSSTLGMGSCFTVTLPTGSAHLPPDRIGATRSLASTALGATPFIEEAAQWLTASPTCTDCEPASVEVPALATATPTVPSDLTAIVPTAPAARILVVDDNADMRHYVQRILGQRYEVEAAADGRLALSTIQQRLPDLVLTDVMMPHVDGFALLRSLRSLPETRELPIILLSARAGEESRIEGLEAGADDYLIKPFSNRELLARVEACLKMAQMRREATRREQALRQELEQRVIERTAELQHLNTELQQSESTLRTFFDSTAIPMGILELHDDDLLHISANEAAAHFLGTTVAQVENQFASQLGVLPVVIAQWRQYCQESVRTQAPVKFDYLRTLPTGQRWLSGSVCLIPMGTNEHPRFSYFVEDITDRKQAEDHIKASLKEKEVLLKEIHHRVKNNLGIVSSLLQIQSRYIQDLGTKLILKNSQNRIASIALVHEKLYRSKDLANIDFAQYLYDLTIYLFDSYNISSSKITLDIQVAPISLDIETAVPCGLIVNELVSNALKHAFPGDRTGTIQVSLVTPSDESAKGPYPLTLIVRDDGIGLPPDFDPETSTTLGISLVQGLVEQIQGEIFIDRDRLEGTEVRLNFKGGRFESC